MAKNIPSDSDNQTVIINTGTEIINTGMTNAGTEITGQAPKESSEVLSDELWFRIFLYLKPDAQCLFLLARVCRQWSRISKDDVIWHPLLLGKYNYSLPVNLAMHSIQSVYINISVQRARAESLIILKKRRNQKKLLAAIQQQDAKQIIALLAAGVKVPLSVIENVEKDDRPEHAHVTKNIIMPLDEFFGLYGTSYTYKVPTVKEELIQNYIDGLLIPVRNLLVNLNSKGFELLFTNEKGWTALHYLTCFGNLEQFQKIVEALGDFAADIILLPNDAGDTVLHMICELDKKEMHAFVVEILGERIIEAAAIENNDGLVPYSYLMCREFSENEFKEYFDIFNTNFLYQIAINNTHNKSLCHYPCSIHGLAFLQQLTELEFHKFFTQDYSGKTPLHYCSMKNTTAAHFLSLLIALGTDAHDIVAIQDYKGRTVLHLLILHWNATTQVKLELLANTLAEAEGDIAALCDRENHSALYYLFKNNTPYFRGEWDQIFPLMFQMMGQERIKQDISSWPFEFCDKMIRDWIQRKWGNEGFTLFLESHVAQSKIEILNKANYSAEYSLLHHTAYYGSAEQFELLLDLLGTDAASIAEFITGDGDSLLDLIHKNKNGDQEKMLTHAEEHNLPLEQTNRHICAVM